MLSQDHSYPSLRLQRHWYEPIVTCSRLFDVSLVRLDVYMNGAHDRSPLWGNHLLYLQRLFVLMIISASRIRFHQSGRVWISQLPFLRGKGLYAFFLGVGIKLVNFLNWMILHQCSAPEYFSHWASWCFLKQQFMCRLYACFGTNCSVVRICCLPHYFTSLFISQASVQHHGPHLVH